MENSQVVFNLIGITNMTWLTKKTTFLISSNKSINFRVDRVWKISTIFLSPVIVLTPFTHIDCHSKNEQQKQQPAGGKKNAKMFFHKICNVSQKLINTNDIRCCCWLFFFLFSIFLLIKMMKGSAT